MLAGYVPYQVVYLRQLLGEHRWGTLVKEAWAARDVIGPLARELYDQGMTPFAFVVWRGIVAGTAERVREL